MGRRIVDLILPIHEGMTTFPGSRHPVVEITQLGRHEIEKGVTRRLALGTHTAIHCAAPRHFIPAGETVGRLALDALIGPASVIDFSACRPGREVDMVDFERQLEDRRFERMVMLFDWSDRWGRMEYYTDHPFLSQAAARWLVDRGVRLLAMDTPMPDNPARGRGAALDSPNYTAQIKVNYFEAKHIDSLGVIGLSALDA